MHFYRWPGDQLEGLRNAPRRPGHRAEGGARPAPPTITYEEALRDKVIVGTPGRVTDRLQALSEELTLDGILAELNCGSLIQHDRVMNSLQLLCEKVMPLFR